MAFYRKNIGGAHQVLRVGPGIGAAILALALLSGLAAWLAAASGLAVALSGVVGYCPLCSVAEVDGRRSGS